MVGPDLLVYLSRWDAFSMHRFGVEVSEFYLFLGSQGSGPRISSPREGGTVQLSRPYAFRTSWLEPSGLCCDGTGNLRGS